MTPTSMDELVRDTRIRLQRLRRLFPDPDDFEHYVRDAVRSSLVDLGYPPQVVQTTLKAMFGQ